METSKEVFFAGQLKFKKYLERNLPSNPSFALPLLLHFQGYSRG